MMHHYGGGGGGSASSFSVFLSVPNHGAADMYSSSTNYASSSSSPSSVDCTLSLGTPSTRSSEFDGDKRAAAAAARNHHRRSAGSYVSNFCWDLLHPKHKTSGRGGGGGGASNNNINAAVSNGGDPLLARRCANCDTTSTPLWRNGPRGPKSLCNACGIRFKKEERRAAAATVNSSVAESNHHHHHHHHPMFNGSYTNSNTWVPQQLPATTQKHPCLSAAIGNEDVGPENGISFLSWRLNVANTDHRPTLVHDFTR
ncbi:GATA transcription factor 18 isoform X1 [Cucumis sativus]|uniref:GATA-type domain-containing protein n=1 Tax=Cucumis sativus TaxID=3659 RepID=A0A0A0KY15_CUCSA|nr:GATA transcription factor 18 isoform X1 [Cucumis sativus]